jgi:hypothetical protein
MREEKKLRVSVDLEKIEKIVISYRDQRDKALEEIARLEDENRRLKVIVDCYSERGPGYRALREALAKYA